MRRVFKEMDVTKKKQMVKEEEGWKLKKFIENEQNAYARSFSRAKVKYMKNYVRPCIREKNPDYAILHVRTHELNSDLPPERIAKPIINIAKNTQSKNLVVSVSGVLPGNDNFNIKSIEVNKELSIMFDTKK